MIESHINKQLEEMIDRYVNGQLTHEEIEELWVELIQDEHHLDYLKTVANTKAVIESDREKANIFNFKQSWAYAAAAAIALLIGVLTVMNFPTSQPETVEPISQIELDYYRSENGVVASETHRQILKDALSLANSGNTDEAIRILQNELQSTGDPAWSAELHLNIGSLYYNSGAYDRAVDNFEQVIQKETIDVLILEKGYWYLGNAYFQLNQLDKAETAIQKAYDLNGAYRRVARSYLDALASN